MSGFDEVVRGLKQGRRYQRAGWNGKGMFVFLVAGSTFKVNREPLLSILGEGTEVQYHSHVDMKTATGDIVPWICSQTDLFGGRLAGVDSMTRALLAVAFLLAAVVGGCSAPILSAGVCLTNPASCN